MNKLSKIRFGGFLGVCLALTGSSLTGQQPEGRTSDPAPSTNQAPADWNRYTVKDRNFSVLLPTVPAMSAYDWDRNRSSAKVGLRNLIAVYSDGVVYAIYIHEGSVALKEIPKTFKIPEGVASREIQVASVRGIEYGTENGNNRSQMFVSAGYIYQFATRSFPRENPDVNVAKFFGSIRFERTKTDRAILEGPGAPPLQDSGPGTATEDKIMKGKEVTKKAIVVTKPEPSYTETARKNQVTGTVVLRGVFSSSGAMTGVRLISGLPHGLNEKAMEAARQIKFIPAIKDGHFVSMHIQLEYSFNLY